MRGARLELLPSTLTDWGTWRRIHTDTLALDAAGGPTRFDVDRMQIAVEVGDEALAVPVDELRSRGVVNTEVGGVPVAFVAEPAPGGWWALYSRTLDDRVVSLALVDGGAGRTGRVRAVGPEPWPAAGGRAAPGPARGAHDPPPRLPGPLPQRPGVVADAPSARRRNGEAYAQDAPGNPGEPARYSRLLATVETPSAARAASPATSNDSPSASPPNSTGPSSQPRALSANVMITAAAAPPATAARA